VSLPPALLEKEIASAGGIANTSEINLYAFYIKDQAHAFHLALKIQRFCFS
jgi:hypothetical protein